MSPSKFQDSDVRKGMINGPRPLPLRVNKNSHVINKASSHNLAAADAAAGGDQLGVKLPVIIYTHSPKVIHTRAGAFMAVVQRLTGLQRDEDSDGDEAAAKSAAEAVKEQDSFLNEKEVGGVNGVGFDEHNETTSVLMDDRRFMGGVKQEAAALSPPPPMYKMSNAYFLDASLFTPNSNEFLCSPRPNPFFQSPNAAAAANSISPSVMDYMKAFPDC